MKSIAPSFRHSTSALWSAVSTITGMSFSSASSRITFRTSMPLMPGICKSSMTSASSSLWVFICASASEPSEAYTTS